MTERSGRRIRDRMALIIMLALIAALLCYFLKDILIPFVRLELRNDVEGAKELLRDRGWMGLATVTLVEALQMVVIFVPAEFIQISSGLSYPFPLALLLCDLGVCLGATIIFVLVRVFRFRNSVFEKRRGKLDRFSQRVHARSTVILLYLLFFMPVIPFGAICYWGSGRKLSYRRYLLTVATGVIPSIVVSNLMGAAGRAFLVRDLPLWLLVLVIVLLAAALFAVIFVFLDRFLFRESECTPDSPVYAMLFALARLWRRKRQRVRIEDKLLREVEAPYLLLCNHESFFDFYYVSQLDHPRNPSYLINEYYTSRPGARTLARRAGFISKKLFTPDITGPAGILRMIRRGYPVIVFPEGRLSPDGRSNPIVEPGGRFYRMLDADLVLVKIRGAYYAKPKWRRRDYRAEVRVTVERVVRREEKRAMSAEALDALIVGTLYGDASADPPARYPQRDKARGLEGILYRCADCGALYTTVGRGCGLTCTACGRTHRLDDAYRFEGEPATIPAYYDRIRALERAELDSLCLRAAVRTKIFGANGGPVRREEGECILTPEEFTYRTEKRSFTIPTADLPALAFSCREEFELYHEGELHYFYPLEHPQQAARWALAVDLLAERRKQGRQP